MLINMNMNSEWREGEFFNMNFWINIKYQVFYTFNALKTLNYENGYNTNVIQPNLGQFGPKFGFL